jgi:hydroxymethylglutaryl-CoA lyase
VTYPAAIEIVEVSPRDGLQDESASISTRTKVELIARLTAAGTRRIEAVSFVRPDVVPQMSDAEMVMAQLPRERDVRICGLILNERGLRRAIASGVDEVNVVVPVTDTFAQRNQGTTVSDAMALAKILLRGARDAGLNATLTLAVAFGCPYEGVVDPQLTRTLARRAASFEPTEIALADTIGCAVPTDVSDLVTALGHDTEIPLRVHLHNSRNTGFANAVAAIAAGASALDASLGGLGGCPFAPGATGNIATEDLAYMLARMNVTTGLDLNGLMDASRWLARTLDRPLDSQLSKAGPFPRS